MRDWSRWGRFDPRVILTTIHSPYRQEKIVTWAKRTVDPGVDGVSIDGFTFAYDHALWGLILARTPPGTTPGVKLSLANDASFLYIKLSRPGLTYKTYIDIRLTYDDQRKPSYSLSVHQGDVEVLDLMHENKSIGYGAKEVSDVLEVKVPFSLIGRPGRIRVGAIGAKWGHIRSDNQGQGG